MSILLRWLLLTAAIVISAYIVPGVQIAGFWSAFWLAALLGILNAIVKPVLIILTLPINILTLGLFIFVINATIILFASSIVKGFNVDGFLTALLFSIILSIVSYLLNKLTSEG